MDFLSGMQRCAFRIGQKNVMTRETSKGKNIQKV